MRTFSQVGDLVPPTPERREADDDLLQRFLRGQPAACRRIERWVWEIIAFKYWKIPKDDWDDVIQEALASTWRATTRPGFEIRGGLRALVRTIATARCIDWMRRRKPSEPLDETEVDPAPGPYDLALARNESAQVRWALQHVAQGCRDLIRMHYGEGLGYGEIARELGRAEATLRVRMFHCIRAMRKMCDRWKREPGSARSTS